MEQLQFEDTPTSRCAYYRRTCDLPASVEPPAGRIAITAGKVWGITMPSVVGHAVKTHMEQRQQPVGPIVSHPRSQRWTFLVQPDIPDEVPLFGELFRHCVSVARAGAQIVLPSPSDQQGQFRRWVEPPRDGFRPSGMAVIESLRTCTKPRV